MHTVETNNSSRHTCININDVCWWENVLRIETLLLVENLVYRKLFTTIQRLNSNLLHLLLCIWISSILFASKTFFNSQLMTTDRRLIDSSSSQMICLPFITLSYKQEKPYSKFPKHTFQSIDLHKVATFLTENWFSTIHSQSVTFSCRTNFHRPNECKKNPLFPFRAIGFR